ncbi:MAG: hydantoinase/oxoprolinase family protein [Candidatus Heimdallarchaeota archaeon]
MGLDIGGANTKAAFILFENNKISKSYSYIEYFPFWEKNLQDIIEMLNRIVENLIEANNFNLPNVDYFTITITAELSDAFQTKREGIFIIIEALENVFEKEKLRFITTRGIYVDMKMARDQYLSIAAANWASTALFLGQFVPRCILIDAGSTTIDIIPINEAFPVPKGTDDISRLINHELIYTGGLRATIPSITHHVYYKDKKIRVSFEKFALISDVHRILGNISEDEYLNDTADNRSKSLNDCYARLSRVICMDIDLISKDDLNKIANYIYEKQLNIITREIRMFMNNLITRYEDFRRDPIFVLTGSSSSFLIKRPLESLGYKNVCNYKELTKIPNNINSSAFAVVGAFYYHISQH